MGMGGGHIGGMGGAYMPMNMMMPPYMLMM
jgi:hypothetical protein